MKCEICQHAESRVVRTDATDTGIQRRRECLRCKHRWTTAELTVAEIAELQKIRDLARPLADLVR